MCTSLIKSFFLYHTANFIGVIIGVVAGVVTVILILVVILFMLYFFKIQRQKMSTLGKFCTVCIVMLCTCSV